MRTHGANFKWASTIIVIITAVLSIVISILWLHATSFPLLADDILNLIYACRLTSIEYGTIYSFGYCGLRQVIPDILLAFEVKQVIAILILALLTARLAVTYRASLLVSCCIGLWVTIILLRTNGTAYVALTIAVLGCLFAHRFPKYAWGIFCITIGCAFLIRTEYLIALIAGTIILIASNVLKLKMSQTSIKRKVIFGFICIIGCIALFTLSRQYSARSPDYIPREWLAFGQNYTLNVEDANGKTHSSLMEWTTTVNAAFPNSNSVLAAVLENPSAFGWHVSQNLGRNLLPSLVATLILPMPFILQTLAALALLTVVGLGFWQTKTLGFKEQDLIPLTLAFVPLFGITFVRPNSEYLLAFLPLIVISVVRGVNICLQRKQRLWYGVLAVLAATLTIGTGLQFVAFGNRTATRATSILSVVQYLQQATADKPYSLFASWYADRICILAKNSQCTPINFMNELRPGFALSNNNTPAALFKTLQPEWVIIGSDWPTLSVVQQDELLLKLVMNPQQYGCAAIATTWDGYTLLQCR